MKGRKPTPTALRLIKGNPSGRPLPAREAVLDRAEPPPPSFLGPEALVEWGRVVGVLYRAGLMTGADRAVLAAYCQAYGVWEVASRLLAAAALVDPTTSGLVITTKAGNLIHNPLVSIVNKSRLDMARFAAEFGMTPSARARVEATPPHENENRAAGDYFTSGR